MNTCRRGLCSLLLGVLTLLATSLDAAAQSTPAERFVDTPAAASAALSPSGGAVAYIQHLADEDRLIVADLASSRVRALQRIPHANGDLMWVTWKGDGRLVIGVRLILEVEGRPRPGSHRHTRDQEFSLFRVAALDPDGGNVVEMFQGNMRSMGGGLGSTMLLDDLPSDPNHVLLSTWSFSGYHVFRANVHTGAVERVLDGGENTQSYFTDGEGNVVMRMDVIPDRSGYRIHRRAAGAQDWTFVLEARRAATATNSPDFEPLGPGPGRNQVYVLARPDSEDLSSLYLYDASTGERGDPVYRAQSADADSPWVHPVSRQVFATCENGPRHACRLRDATVQRHLRAIDSFFGERANIRLVDLSLDETKWLLRVEGPTEPGGYYVYDRTAAVVEPVAEIWPNLDHDALSPVEIVTYQSRDGTSLWAYITARPGQGPRPVVVMPHGGPEARDAYGFDPFAQFLASRGYVVVQPNFRGSSGFGRAFADAGRGQWGRRMQDDITDAVQHVINSGVADPARICIMGGSYGGYAALAGVTLTPELYRCAISINGVSDLRHMLRVERGEGGAGAMGYQYWVRSIGQPGDEWLVQASPAEQAARVRVPVLLIHGEEDFTVPIRQSEIMNDRLRDAGKDVRFVRIRGENHYWNTWSRENRLTMLQETERFLAQHLGAAN
jgi:dipeptidyl aminopeptidase/acylaminoacyl peptidase